jgi:hypothetical protein
MSARPRPTAAHAIVAAFWVIMATFLLLIAAVFGALPAALPLYAIGLACALIGALLVTRPSLFVVGGSLVGGLALAAKAASEWTHIPGDPALPAVTAYGVIIVLGSALLITRAVRRSAGSSPARPPGSPK